jgi:hypothetical protein
VIILYIHINPLPAQPFPSCLISRCGFVSIAPTHVVQGWMARCVITASGAKIGHLETGESEGVDRLEQVLSLERS